MQAYGLYTKQKMTEIRCNEQLKPQTGGQHAEITGCQIRIQRETSWTADWADLQAAWLAPCVQPVDWDRESSTQRPGTHSS